MFEWISHNTNEKDVILSTIIDGHFISGISRRKNVHDSDFIFIDDLKERSDDIKKIYTSFYQTQALKLLTKYGVDYIIVTDEVRRDYGFDQLEFVNDKKCFRLVYNEGSN